MRGRLVRVLAEAVLIPSSSGQQFRPACRGRAVEVEEVGLNPFFIRAAIQTRPQRRGHLVPPYRLNPFFIRAAIQTVDVGAGRATGHRVLIPSSSGQQFRPQALQDIENKGFRPPVFGLILFSMLNRYFDTTQKSTNPFEFNCLHEFGMMAILGPFCHSKFRSKTHYNTKSDLCQGLGRIFFASRRND